MIDITHIRENSEQVKENLKRKSQEEKIPLIEEIKKQDEQWRKQKYQSDNLRKERNILSEAINKAKKEKDEKKVKKLIAEAKALPEKIKKAETKAEKLHNERDEKLKKIPNFISKKVPMGKSDKENVIEKTIGKPKKYNFEVKNHVELLESLRGADFDASARVAGTGFYYLEGKIALLNQALLNYARDIMVQKGFTYVETPVLLREDIINRVTDLNDKQQQIYLVEDEPKMALIGTSEHSLIGRYVDREIPFQNLPIKHTSYSMCFRKEIGAHGIDEKGLFRTHQFNKIEMIVICKPEESESFFTDMQNITVEIFKNLGIPIRILRICSGDLGDLKYEQVDIEAYSPRRNDYFEVGSCSNLTDAQARRLNISTRIKGNRITPHTLNNTALASSRALVALIENNQQKNGSIKIPKILHTYTGFTEIKVEK